MTTIVDTAPSSAPEGRVPMSAIRNQAADLTLQLWLQHGMHPVHLRYLLTVTEGTADVVASVHDASEEVQQVNGDAYTLVARSAQEDPDYTHLFFIPHNTVDGELLVIAEGGGEFCPGSYRVATHTTLYDALADESTRYQINHVPLDVHQGFLASSTLN